MEEWVDDKIFEKRLQHRKDDLAEDVGESEVFLRAWGGEGGARQLGGRTSGTPGNE